MDVTPASRRAGAPAPQERPWMLAMAVRPQGTTLAWPLAV